jgi:hypothetical protein
MLTTLSIDDDVLAAATPLAERAHRTVGEVIFTLARRGLSDASQSGRTDLNGIPQLAGRPGASPVTLERIDQLRDPLS